MKEIRDLSIWHGTVTDTTLTGDVSLSGGKLNMKSSSLSGKMVEEWGGIGDGVVTKVRLIIFVKYQMMKSER